VKKLLLHFLILVSVIPVFSATMGKKIIQGIVRGFDQHNVTLENSGKRIRIQRDKFPKGTKFEISSDIVRAAGMTFAV
jgi:hypothetical protein